MGGGSGGPLSDRAVKTNVEALEDAVVLDHVASLPISSSVAFGVGEDNKHITSIDEDGVALAAIKALNAQLAQKDAALHALQRQVAAMKSQMLRHNASVERKLAQLGARMTALR